MGTILSSRMKDDGKVIFEIAVDYDEAVQLGGHMDKVHIFSENMGSIETYVSQRGKNEATKYFLIPKSMRKNIDMNMKIRCQKIETKNSSIFVYISDKLGL